MRLLTILSTLSITAGASAQEEVKIQLHMVCAGCTAHVTLITDSTEVEEPVPVPLEVWLKVVSVPRGTIIQMEAESAETSTELNWIEMSILAVDPSNGLEASADGNGKVKLAVKVP